MNEQRIRWIIGLMAAALLGSICLQIYWITWNIRLNEEQFDKNVFETLNRVADRLQNYEDSKVLQAVHLAQEASSQETRNLFHPPQNVESGHISRRILRDTGEDNIPVRIAPSLHDNATKWEFMKVSQMIDARPLAERIELDMLTQTMKEELSSHGIFAQPRYGIYAKAQNAYVIMNDHYVVNIDASQASAGASGNSPTLETSPYRVGLFSQDIESPGYLTIYFPNRTSLLLSSVWPTLLLSVIFTGLIFFCFYYTVSVIFRQKKLSEMKTDFINNMTHEFKTPIATISLAADSIGNQQIIDKPDRIRRFLDIIRQENRRMNSQVERVLQMALIDKDDFQLKVGEVDLHDLIEQAAANFGVQVEKREGTLETDLQATHSMVEGDATHLTGIIHNLLDNANKYSPENPEITIATRDVPIGIEITVQDRGIGISKEARKHIFDKFYRVHTGNVHDVKGFGLGLSYVKAIVVAHKGVIDLKSEPGKGSSFIITLPVRENGAGPVEETKV
jgi:two-component system phosphate regulon sensor histidine kinase PhoR